MPEEGAVVVEELEGSPPVGDDGGETPPEGESEGLDEATLNAFTQFGIDPGTADEATSKVVKSYAKAHSTIGSMANEIGDLRSRQKELEAYREGSQTRTADMGPRQPQVTEDPRVTAYKTKEVARLVALDWPEDLAKQEIDSRWEGQRLAADLRAEPLEAENAPNAISREIKEVTGANEALATVDIEEIAREISGSVSLPEWRKATPEARRMVIETEAWAAYGRKIAAAGKPKPTPTPTPRAEVPGGPAATGLNRGATNSADAEFLANLKSMDKSITDEQARARLADYKNSGGR